MNKTPKKELNKRKVILTMTTILEFSSDEEYQAQISDMQNAGEFSLQALENLRKYQEAYQAGDSPGYYGGRIYFSHRFVVRIG